jgi:hypothetical protein
MTDLRMSLNGFKTKNSLLFLFSPDNHHHSYCIQKELFYGCESIFREHGLVLAEIFEQGSSHIGNMELGADTCDYLRKLLNAPAGQFKVLLLGKDQRVKMMTDGFVSDRELLVRLESETEHMEAAFS